MVTHNPLHRSGRAALPHPAPTLGDDAEANEWVGMPDADGRLPPRTHRLPQHREATRPLPRATVREAEEVEGLGLPVAPPSSILVGKLAKLDEARLAGMQLQAEPAEPLAQLGQEPLGVLAMLESHDEVIGKPHDDDVAVGLRLPPPLDPE